MKFLETSLADARKVFNSYAEELVQTEQNTNPSASSDELQTSIQAMNQFFDIAEGVDKSKQEFVTNDITDIGEHGLSVLEKLAFKANELQLDETRQVMQQMALVIADWVIQRNGQINLLEPIVDALAQTANATKDTAELITLADFIGEIADACSDAIKQDIELSNMHRPWRLLNINRGIVATRSHDVDTIQHVFSDLITALPMDAPGFFKEGMSEMVRMNYPEHVREIMQDYFDKTDMPQIH